MSAFQIIEGDYVIVSQSGVYKQVPLAERDGILYAVVSGGYVQLRADGGTSKDKLRFVELSYDKPLHQTSLGKLCRHGTPNSLPLPDDKTKLLLSAPA